jgi:hypothetical protein
MRDELRLPPKRDMPPESRQVRRQHLLREIQPLPRRRRPGRLLILVPIGAVLIGSAAYAGTRLFHDDASRIDKFFTISCYESASPDAKHLDYVPKLAGPAGQSPGDRSPTEVCAGYWEQGRLGPGGGAPPLEACARREAKVAVFPAFRTNTCGAAGLEPLGVNYQSRLRRGEKLISRLTRLFHRCGNPDRIERKIARITVAGGADRPHLTLRNYPGRNCGPGYPRRVALIAAIGTPLKTETSHPGRVKNARPGG